MLSALYFEHKAKRQGSGLLLNPENAKVVVGIKMHYVQLRIWLHIMRLIAAETITIRMFFKILKNLIRIRKVNMGEIRLRKGALVSPTNQMPLTIVSDVSKVYAYFSMNEKEYLDFIQNAKGETKASAETESCPESEKRGS